MINAEIPFDLLIDAIRERAGNPKLPVVVSACAKEDVFTVKAGGVELSFPCGLLVESVFLPLSIAGVANGLYELMKEAAGG